MDVLFAHQNFPGQYLHLARHLAASGKHRVAFITQRRDAAMDGVRTLVYQPPRPYTPNMHHYLRETEVNVLNAQKAAGIALALRNEGFVPDVMLGHNAWGEIWYLRDVFPRSPLIGYFEFYYRPEGADYGFDPDEPRHLDDGPRIRTRNLGNLLGLEAATLGQCPTGWQRSRYPARYHPMLRVVHEGIDTRSLAPDPSARFELPGGRGTLAAGDDVVTYVARDLEPYRGFPTFMRSLPAILRRRPRAQVAIVGGDGNSYGPAPEGNVTFRETMLRELGDSLDPARVHFLGRVPYPALVRLLQVSRAHVYLTYPFILSWSMLEAMSLGCLVVGSRTAPVEEVIRHGENGLLADFFSPDEVADGVVRALENHADCRRMRQAARRTVVERYDLERVCLPMQLALIEEAIAIARASPA
jgi:glycosyltransferase involved in cell wall biosynthesis